MIAPHPSASAFSLSVSIHYATDTKGSDENQRSYSGFRPESSTRGLVMFILRVLLVRSLRAPITYKTLAILAHDL
jgi:hypothetical protein